MAGLQTVTPPVTGTGISSTTFGVPVATNLGVLANPPIAKMRNSVGISVANNTATALTWDTEDFDTVNGHSTTTNTSRYTCQTGYAGYYLLSSTVAWTGSATGFRSSFFRINGTTAVAGSQAIINSGSSSNTVTTETKVFLNVADYVEVIVQQTSTAPLSTITGANGLESWFEVQWVHQ